ncbi:uncharacterized protein LOC128552945 isoform X2 [Mercenaria mercenaria]|uniref:uncharacterized protein LOC128552945 isoform X2 n=1 Tax=Mercenaria mercenaria TaxID=6596 RepID=UPI00234F64DF|nr:uncharacterized protein LOC128552945 isoform X2 [Mercenaria mercenaria]
MSLHISHETDTKRSRRNEFLLAVGPQTLIEVIRMRQLFQTSKLAHDDLRLFSLIKSQSENETAGTSNGQKNYEEHTGTEVNSEKSCENNDDEESCEDKENEHIKKLIDELQLLDDQIKKYESHVPRRLSADRTVENRNQNRKMTRKNFLSIGSESPKFNVEDLSIKKACPALHSPLKENPDRYKRPRGKIKCWWNICLFVDCLTLQVDIVVADWQLNVRIYLLKPNHPACSTLALNEHRVIERSDREVRSPQLQTYICPDESGLESSDVMEDCHVKQEKWEPRMPLPEKLSYKDISVAVSAMNSKGRVWRMFKPFMVCLFMTTVFGSGYAAQPDTDVSNTEMVQSKQLLRTNTCNDVTLYNSKSTCQTNDESLRLLIDFCKFRELCHTDEEPVCINAQGTGVFVCLKKDLKCAKGYLMTAVMDAMNPDFVNLQVQKCPKGTFQSHESDCIHACYDTHRDLQHMSEKYIVYSEGDNESPAEVYCNYRDGYFSREGGFLLDYDLKEQYNHYFCVHTSDYQQCKATQYPLPNGTCTGSCEEGYFRDDHDGFSCKPIQKHKVHNSSFVTEVTSGNGNGEGTSTTNANVDYDQNISTPMVIVIVVAGVFFLAIVFAFVLLFRKYKGYTCTLPFCNREIRAGSDIGVEERTPSTSSVSEGE